MDKKSAQNIEKPDTGSKSPESLKPLSDLPRESRAIVRYLRGGRGFSARLASMGVTPGVEVTVLQNFGRGPMIVTVRDTRIALGRGEAHKVLVEAL
ncbi:MAG: ferrous iron transport protein A [Chloroflexi bacterium]|nr:ferrous iron transport protein A [Chloroflexota bacterium]